jgi:MFS family permease
MNERLNASSFPLSLPRPQTDAVLLSLLAASCAAVAILINPFAALAVVMLPVLALVIMLFVRYPRVWLYTGAVVNYFWISQGKGDTEITLLEYALVAFYIGGLWIWFFAMVFIKRKRIVRNIADRILLIAIGAASITIVLAFANDESSPLNWVREYLLFSMMLYYFPWREHLTERKHILTFFALTAGVFIGIGAVNLWQYVKAASNILYAFQVWSSRKTDNTHIFLCATIFCFMATFFASTRRARLGMLVLTAFYTLVVVVSFSRGFWISGIIGIITALWLFNKRKLAMFALYGIVGAFLFITSVQILFPERAALIVKVLQARLVSSTAGTQDLSVLSRVYETKVIFEYMSRYILGGTGLGATFVIYDPLGHVFTRVSFIHNGYLYIWMKLGLAFFLAFYFVWAYMIYRSYILAKTASQPIHRIFATGAFGSLIAFSLLNITSAIPEGRQGFYCLSILYVAISYADNFSKNHIIPTDRQ